VHLEGAKKVKKQDELNEGLVKGLEVLVGKEKAIRFRVSELERKAAGTTRANGEVEQLRKELEAVAAQIAGGNVNDSVVARLDKLDTSSTAIYLQVAEMGDRILRIENSESQQINFEESKIKVAHKSEIDTQTPWAQAFAWGGVGAILGLLLFGVMANVENAWIGVLSFALIGLFVSAFVLTKLNLRLQIEAQHDWAKKQPPVVVVNEDVEDPTSQWWASDQAQVE
jgi:hypothetical protein